MPPRDHIPGADEGKAAQIERFRDPMTAAPTVSLRLNSGQVEVVWNKDGMEAVEIQKDTGTGWQFLAMDTRPNYTDTTPPAVWKYRASYYQNSQRFGQWSPVVEITVGS